MNYKKCSTQFNNKIITASENKMTFVINNKNMHTIRKVIVDGCLINDHRSRCDYLFEFNSPTTDVIYLELKGCDIEKALKQLESTINICSQDHHQFKRSCHVVASRVPKMGTKLQALKKKFVTQNKVSLNVHTTKYIFSFT